MSKPRSVSEWITRRCKICNVEQPRSAYEWVKKTAITGVSTIRTCHDCKRRMDRYRKHKDYYSVKGKRAEILERNKRYQQYSKYDAERLERYRDYSARWVWANRRANDLLELDVKALVCVRPATEAPIHNERRDERYGMDIGIRFVGQQIPHGWRPIMWVESGMVEQHKLCPPEWAWFVRFVERRAQKRIQEAHNGKAKQTLKGA
jgi:hypothetical protein